jgi:hypothetical protein
MAAIGGTSVGAPTAPHGIATSVDSAAAAAAVAAAAAAAAAGCLCCCRGLQVVPRLAALLTTALELLVQRLGRFATPSKTLWTGTL